MIPVIRKTDAIKGCIKESLGSAWKECFSRKRQMPITPENVDKFVRAFVRYFDKAERKEFKDHPEKFYNMASFRSELIENKAYNVYVIGEVIAQHYDDFRSNNRWGEFEDKVFYTKQTWQQELANIKSLIKQWIKEDQENETV
jgi:hypothetical protein